MANLTDTAQMPPSTFFYQQNQCVDSAKCLMVSSETRSVKSAFSKMVFSHRRNTMTTNLKRSVGKMHDVQELRELRKAIVERIDLLEKRAHAKRVDDHWQSLKDVPVGTVLHVCSTGTFFGGPFQRGDSMTVFAVQPRARRVWVRMNDKQYWIEAPRAEQYLLKTTPPERPMSQEERARVDRMAGRMAEALA